MKIQFALLSILLLVMTCITSIPLAKAADETTYNIDYVKVDGMIVSTGNDKAIGVERGNSVVIEVFYSGTGMLNSSSVDNARVKAWIGGYEYSDIDDRSEIFTVEPGVQYRKTLRLELPDDMDSDDEYRLHVELYDDDNSVEYSWPLYIRVKAERHKLVIQDTIFNPGLSVEAGKVLFAKVRLENLGDKKEEDIKVTVTIPQLGLSTRTYIDELVAREGCEDTDCDDDEETSASTEDMWLKIPEDALGSYDVIVSVDYDRGHSEVEETYTLLVREGVVTPTIKDITVNVDSVTQTGEISGTGAAYKFTFTNLGNVARTFVLDVTGTSDWATTRVDPATVTVNANDVSEMVVHISPKNDAELGKHTFTVTVKSNGKVFKTFNLETDVTTTAASDSWQNVRTGLVIAFIILLIVLVILGLVIAARKVGRGRDEEEGKSYY